MMRIFLAMLLAASLSACATGGATHAGAADHPEATPYGTRTSAEDSSKELEATKVAAAVQNKLVLAVFGADWCHDSRALAGWLETPRFQSLIDESFAVIYIDAGTPQNGKGRNLGLAEQYGVKDITGTPTLLVIEPTENIAVNADTAKSWRNAASRSEDEIFDELALLATTEVARE